MPRRRPTNRLCVLVSGGIESAALVVHLLRRGKAVYPVYVRSGYRWEKAELYWLRRFLAAIAARRLKPLACLHVPAREFSRPGHWGFTGRAVPGAGSSDKAVYLPGRNLMLLCSAAVFCARKDIDAVALGTLSGNPFLDASPAFFSSLERALTNGFGRPFRVTAPFHRMTKNQVIRRSGNLPWRLTFSCLAPVERRPCQNCNKCEERRKVLSGPL